MDIKKIQGNKECAVSDFKAVSQDGVVRISGYANTKHTADRYGDIPTEYNRPYVYELEEFKRNPVLLLDHCAAVRNIVGSVTNIYEDERGLYFEAELSQSDLADIKHARQLIQEGHLKTVSIGGMWLFEDTSNPSHLTLAKIFEISLVAVPADTHAIIGEAKSAESIGEKMAEIEKKLTVFEMNQKLNKFAVKTKQPATGQGAK